MPQFDQGSFLNQVLWFFLVFINSYFLITYFFLPIISKNLKFRKKKISVNQKNLSDIQLENLQQQIFLNKTFQNISDHYNISLKKIGEESISQIRPLRDKVFNNVTFKNILVDFCAKLTFYPKKFN